MRPRLWSSGIIPPFPLPEHSHQVFCTPPTNVDSMRIFTHTTAQLVIPSRIHAACLIQRDSLNSQSNRGVLERVRPCHCENKTQNAPAYRRSLGHAVENCTVKVQHIILELLPSRSPHLIRTQLKSANGAVRQKKAWPTVVIQHRRIKKQECHYDNVKLRSRRHVLKLTPPFPKVISLL